MLGQTKWTPASFVSGSSWDPTAIAHYNRVISDGGTIESLSRLNTAVLGLKRIYGALPAKLSAVYDPSIFGYKLGTGSGATLGRAISKLYSLMGATSDVTQTTFNSQPLLLINNALQNYLFVPPSTGAQGITTPHSASNNVTGDIDISVQANPAAIGTTYLHSKRGATAQWEFISTGLVLSFVYWDGAVENTIVASAPVPAGKQFVRVTRNAGTGDIAFYRSATGSSWTQVGTTQASTPGNLISDPTAIVRIGFAPATTGAGGLMYSASLYNGIRENSAPLVNYFSASDYNVSLSYSQLTSSITGETYTITRNASTTGYKAQIVYRTTFQGDAIDDFLRVVAFATNPPNTLYFMVDTFTWTTNKSFMNAAFSITQPVGASPDLQAQSTLGNINFVGEALNSLKCYATVQNGASPASLTQINNAGTTTGPGNNVAGVGISILANGASNQGNGLVNTMILTRTADAAGVRTSMYNLVRSWSDNPA